MANFTMLTKDAVQQLGASYEFVDGQLVVTGNVGLSTYPIFDEAHRPILNSKILRRYWMEEIGVETAELWRFNMESYMLEYMPYFNELYKTTLLEFNPLHTVDIRTTAESETSHESSSTSENDSDSTTGSEARAVNSNFPQAPLRRNADYASSGADSMSNAATIQHTDAESSTTGSDQGNTESATTGYQGIPGDLVIAFRQSIINIDTTIVDSLEEMFMGILNNGATYSDSHTYERYGI